MSNDRTLGEALVEGKVITREQLEECLEIQKNLNELGSNRSLEQVLKDQGYLQDGPSKLSTIPPNSMRRIKCQSCGKRVLVEPGQHEREVVCKKCGEYAIQAPKSEEDDAAPVDFNPVMPSLDLFGGGGGDASKKKKKKKKTKKKQEKKAPKEPERTMALNFDAEDIPREQAVMGHQTDTDRKRRRGGRDTAKARSTRPKSDRESAVRRPSRSQSSRVGRERRQSPPQKSGGGGMIIVGSLLAVLLLAGALAFMNRPPDGPEVTSSGSGEATPTSTTTSGSDSGGQELGGDTGELGGDDSGGDDAGGDDGGEDMGGDSGDSEGSGSAAPSSGDAAEAMKAYRESLDLNDEYEAYGFLTKYIEAKPNDLKMRRELVDLGLKLEEGESLVVHLEALISAKQDVDWALEQLAKVQAQENQYDEAAKVFKRIMDRNPTQVTLARLANAQLDGSKWLEGIDTLATVKRPYGAQVDPIVKSMILKIRHRLRREWGPKLARQNLPPAEAKRALIIAAIDAEDYFPHIAVAYYYLKTNQPAKSLQGLNEAIRKPPTNKREGKNMALLLTWRAHIHRVMGQDEKAIADACQVLNTNWFRAAPPPLRTLLHCLHKLKRKKAYLRTLYAYLWVARDMQASAHRLDVFNRKLKELTGQDEVNPLGHSMAFASYTFAYFIPGPVSKGSPLQPGDRILKYNDVPLGALGIWKDALKATTNSTNPADVMRFEIDRKGTKMNISMTAAVLKKHKQQLDKGRWQLMVRPKTLKD